MATTLSYGYIQPANNDPGSTWFPALNSNITQLNNHTHDGVTSAAISSRYVQPGSVNIPSGAGNWTLVEAGKYSQSVTVPTGYNMVDYSITFYLSTGEIVNPSITKTSNTTFTIFSLYNSVAYVAVFR
jgi:hypothetical protein